jgi:hypothetical protein
LGSSPTLGRRDPLGPRRRWAAAGLLSLLPREGGEGEDEDGPRGETTSGSELRDMRASVP